MSNPTQKLILVLFLIVSTAVFAENTQELMKTAQQLENEGKLLEAIEVYNEILENEPNNVKAERKKMFLQMKLEKAKAKESGESFDSLLEKANDYLYNFDLDNAVAYFEKALKLKPYNVQALLGKADALYVSFKHDEAIPAYKEVLKYDEYNVNALAVVALHFQYNNKYEESAQHYDKLFSLEEIPTDRVNEQNYVDACLVYNKLEDYDKAHQVMERAWAIFPASKDIPFNNADTYFNEHKFEESIDWFDKALSIDNTDVLTWYRKGVSLHRLNRISEAKAAFDRSLELDPEYVNSNYYEAIIFFDYKEYFKAISHINSYLNYWPDSIEMLQLRVACYVAVEMYRNAMIDIDKILTLDPYHESAQLWKTQVQKLLD